MTTLQKLNKIENQKSRVVFNAEFVKPSPILSLRDAVLDYAKTYDDEDGAELRTALRDKVQANLSPLFNEAFIARADQVDKEKI